MKKQIVILLIGLAVMINAQIAIPPSLGTGTESDPYQIATLENLYWIAADSANWDKHYIQTADIDASETRSWFIGDHDGNLETPDEPMGWKPIGLLDVSSFQGFYNGQNYYISSLYLNHIYGFQYSHGLFGYVENSILSNINLIESDIKGGAGVGALVGMAKYSSINGCASTGKVVGNSYIGGLIGYSFGTDTEKSSSTCNVSGYEQETGGLIGRFFGNSVTNSYSIGDVNGNMSGGFIGFFQDGTAKNCFSSGKADKGGFVGSHPTIINITGCFWNTETSGIDSSDFGLGKSTSEMRSITTFTDAGWDFSVIWDINSKNNYGQPFIKNQIFPAEPVTKIANINDQDTTTPEVLCRIINVGKSDIIQHGICWNLTGEPTINDYKTEEGIASSVGDFISEMSNLSLHTKYYVRSYAENSNGLTYSNEFSFYTSPIDPVIPNGVGTEGDPYQISNLGNLYWITADTLNFHSHYIQTADINAAETRNWFVGDHDDDPETPDEPMGWKPIGNFSEEYFAGIFDGVYDGQGHIIDSIYINHVPVSFNESMSGLFGWAQNAEIKNLGVTNSSIAGGSDVGLIAGCFGGTLTNCFSTGNVSGGWAVGGLFGEGGGSINKCSSSATVTGYRYSGGLIGFLLGGTVSQSFTTGNVNCINFSDGGTGGLVGTSDGNIIDCFSSSDIYGAGGTWSAGLVGVGWAENSFSYGKIYSEYGRGLIGEGDAANSFWDTESSGVTISNGGTGLLTVQLKIKQTFLDAGWDFAGETASGTEDIWDMDGVTNNGYPFLTWMTHMLPEAVAPSAGNGTEDDPYQIASLENLYWIAADTLNFHSHYIQTADINAAETRNWFVGNHDNDPETPDEPMGWKPIGGFSEVEALGRFSGSYDGQGHIIDSLYINEITTNFEYSNTTVGLFGFTDNCELSNIRLTNVSITGVDAGALIGCGRYNIVSNCFSTGDVFGSWCAGGLIGEGSGNIEKCYSTANITGYNTTGGLIGYFLAGEIMQSYSTGSVMCINENPHSGVGGLAGDNGGVIRNCFSSSSVEGLNIFGFTGHNYGSGRCENSYCYGNLTGEAVTGFSTSSDAPGCFWDVDATGVPEDSLTWTQAVGLTTVEMKSHSTFTDAGWDFVGESVNGTEDIWDMDGVTNNGYPFLAWMSTTGIEEDDNLQPVEFTLSQNYPNPFNPVTTIKFSIPKDHNVKLSVYNSNGQLVNELINKKLERGNHSVQFNADRLNSGIYFYRIESEKKSIVNKMLLIK